MIGITDKQMLQYFKEMFPPKIEAQLPEIEDIDVAKVKTKFLMLLFKCELPQATRSSMLAHMTEK